ncbi:hypothetical protein [Streptomyces sp. NPDC088816]|uniref:hypothetical protein n=1 Tax=Streptomyces sp. NPDC088816 TaxID=3365906 RepID=UPI003804E2C0
MRRFSLVCAVSVVLLTVACTSNTPTERARQDSGQTLPQHLKLTGLLMGTLTSGLNAQGVIHAEPEPIAGDDALFRQTSCAEFKLGDDASPAQGTPEWEADIYGVVAGQKVALRLTVEDGAVPGDHPIENGRRPGQNSAQAVLDTSGNLHLHYPVVGSGSALHVDADGHSGTLRLFLTDAPWSPHVKEEVSGQWRCA